MLLLLEAAAAAAAACVAATLWPVVWGGGTAGGAAPPPTATAAVAVCVLQSVAVALLLGVRGARRLSARAPPPLRCWALELSPSLPPAGAPAAPAGPAGGRTGVQLPPTAGEAKPLRRVGAGDDDDSAELPVPASVGRRQYPQRAADSPARACDPLPSPSAASPLLPPLDAPPYTSNYSPAASPEAPATPPPFLKRRARSPSSDDGTAAEEEDEGEVQELQVDALLADMCSEEHSVLHEACAAFRAAMQPGEAGGSGGSGGQRGLPEGLVADLCGQGT